jgi:2-keto-4-pentenoate hydratase/2-oxohepta-3-ene-1,7-dioic acid hydratase in catechol pathway
MRLATFEDDGTRRIGLVRDDRVLDLSAAVPELPRTMEEFLALGEDGMQRARKIERTSIEGLPLAEVRLCAPVNFVSHLTEVRALHPNLPEFKHQVWFNKQVTCICGPYDPIHLPEVSEQLDYEGEMAIVIARRCRHVARRDARQVIAGYCVCNDVTVRDWQTRSMTATLGKSFDTHGPIGPWITTADEVGDPQALQIRTWVDGQLRQDGSTTEFVHSIGEMIEELSTVFTLEPGDVLTTGSPAGVGALMQPPQYLRAGQRVRVEIERLGRIENLVIPEPARVAP